MEALDVVSGSFLSTFEFPSNQVTNFETQRLTFRGPIKFQ